MVGTALVVGSALLAIGSWALLIRLDREAEMPDSAVELVAG